MIVGVAIGQIDIEQKIEVAVEGNKTNVTNTDAFSLVFRKVVGRLGDPQRITNPLRQENTGIDI